MYYLYIRYTQDLWVFFHENVVLKFSNLYYQEALQHLFYISLEYMLLLKQGKCNLFNVNEIENEFNFSYRYEFKVNLTKENKFDCVRNELQLIL